RWHVSPSRRLAVVDHRADHSAEHARGSEIEALVAAPTVVRRGGEDAIGETRERHRLQNDATGSAQRRKEQTLTAKQRCLDSRHHLDVIIDLLLHRDETSGVDAKQLTWAERHFMQGA